MIFWGGLFMIAVSFAVFIAFCDPINDKRTWLEDSCAAVMMMGLGIAIIGAIVWIAT
jgi:hypothetical protein